MTWTSRRRGRVKALTARARLDAARLLERVVRRLLTGVRRDLGPDLAAELTAAAYTRKAHYAATWHQDLGLFDFEERALTEHFPAPPARLLVIGCGGGRELVALAERGFTVVGVEPDAALRRSAIQRLGDRAVVRPGDVASVAARSDPDLAGPFDGVIVGWGAWGHVFRRSERVAALACFRQIAPGAPVLLSWPHAPRRGLRGLARTARAVMSPPPPAAHDDWGRRLVLHDDGMFTVRLGPEDLEREARDAGYGRVDYRGPGEAGYPNAVALAE